MRDATLDLSRFRRPTVSEILNTQIEEFKMSHVGKPLIIRINETLFKGLVAELGARLIPAPGCSSMMYGGAKLEVVH